MTGWANIPDAVNAGYEQGYGISDSWIMASMPSKDIYAVWNENQYTIEYDTGISIKVKYSDTVRLPEHHMCIGWLPGEKYPDVRYLPGEEIKVAQLCELMGIDYADNAVIPLYALWEHEPTIQAKDMFFSVKQAHDGMITENLIGSMISAKDVEDGDIAFGNNQTNYLILRNFDDKRIKEVVDKAVMDILIEANGSKNMSILIIGNKSDLEDKRQVTKEDGEQKAANYGVAFMETSAFNGENIEVAFDTMVKGIYEKCHKELEENKEVDIQEKGIEIGTKKGESEDIKRSSKFKDFEYNLKNDMGDRMRFVREVVFSLSQTQFGKYMEVTRNTAKYWDEGQINVDKILKISQRTNISMDFMIRDNYPLTLQTQGMSEALHLAVMTNCVLYGLRNMKQ